MHYPNEISEKIKLLPPLRDVIQKHGLFTKKSLGQHFLLDLNLTDKIARTAGNLENHVVIEIGPGPGGLTRSLLSQGAGRVIAIERDNRCIEALKPLADIAEGRLIIIPEDAMRIEEKTLLSTYGNNKPAKIVANLPYNISTQLLFKWLGKPDIIESMTLMFQKEVAERILAKKDSGNYGRLSILSQWLAESRRDFDISPQAFTPPPKVVSTVITLTNRVQPLYEAPREALENVLRSAFGQRRKKIRTSLKPLISNPDTLLSALNIDINKRAENIDIYDYCKIANAFYTAR